MTRYIAFLRAINAGPGRVVRMDSLRRVFEALGLAHIETFLGTGNVVFESRARSTRTLERRISESLYAALGYHADALIRTPLELSVIARYRPFRRLEIDHETQFNIIFLAAAPGLELAHAVKQMNTDFHRLRLHGRELYWLRRKHPQTGQFTGLPLSRLIDVPYTMRGARTVSNMAARYGAEKEKV